MACRGRWRRPDLPRLRRAAGAVAVGARVRSGAAGAVRARALRVVRDGGDARRCAARRVRERRVPAGRPAPRAPCGGRARALRSPAFGRTAPVPAGGRGRARRRRRAGAVRGERVPGGVCRARDRAVAAWREAAARAGVALEQAGWEDTSIAPASVDAISFWHVLEHLDAPGAALARAAEWLRPGGVVLAGVPNLDSWQARVGGDRWYHLDVPPPPGALHAPRHRCGAARRGTRAVADPPCPRGAQPVRDVAVPGLALDDDAVVALPRPERNAPLASRNAAITAAALPLAPVAATAVLAAGVGGPRRHHRRGGGQRQQ